MDAIVIKRALNLIFIGFSWVILSHCTSLPFSSLPSLMPTKTSQTLEGFSGPPQMEIHQVPYFPQKVNHCGPSALSTVLNFQGVDVEPDQLIDEIFVPGVEGTYAVEISAAVRRYGLISYPLSPALEDLLLEVSGGNPIIVLQNVGLPFIPKWHYATVVGYDLDDQVIILRSGNEKRWVTPINVFDRTWKRSNRWAVAVMKPNQIPVTAKPEIYLKSVLALESLGYFSNVKKSYLMASLHWPGYWLSEFLLGNLAVRHQKWDSASEWYRKALNKEKQNVMIMNNYSVSLSEQGCLQDALDQIECALVLEPENSIALETKAEILFKIKGQTQSALCKKNVICE